MPPITHVIFDVDGLLLDTEPLIAAVAQTIAGRYGKILDKGTLTLTAGRNARDSAQILVDRLGLPLTRDAYLAEKAALVPQIYPKAEAKPGARRLVEHLHRQGIPRAIATSSSPEHLALKARHHPWMGLFNCIVTGEDPALSAGKPAPDIFLLAAQRLGARPENCLVIEDSLAGMAAAQAADMAVVVVPELKEYATQYKGADQILTSLVEFVPENWGLPPYKQS